VCRLFCFPHAGGSASLYRPWRALAPHWLDLCPVELPGRSARFSEVPFRRMKELIAAMHDALRPALDRPFAFFGHSMGASIALAAGLRLRSADGRMASHVFVSGKAPPRTGDAHLHRASDRALLAALASLGLTPRAVLARADMMQALLPMIRADLALAETYAPASGEALSCPLSVFAGENDPVAPAGTMAEWSAFTSAACRLVSFPGGHFFLLDARSDIIRAVSDAMRPGAG
jgi:surfactin synthase thioesterase subunit